MIIIYTGEMMNSSLYSILIPGNEWTVFIGFILQGVGVPIPFPLLFGLLSNLVVRGEVSQIVAVIYAALGSLMGNLAGYYIGYTGGRLIFNKAAGWVDKITGFVSKKGPSVMFLLRWSGGYAQGAWALGVVQTPISIFLLYTGLANILRAVFWVFAGRVLIQKLFY
jgi:membrane protein DedA with SNARE-associated domain